MTHRALPLLLVALSIVGITTGTCLQGRCPAMGGAPPERGAMVHHGAHHPGEGQAMARDGVEEAAAHDCCDRAGVAVTGPHCCPMVQAASEPSPAAFGRAGDAVPLAATRLTPCRLTRPALVRHETPRRFDPGAPPGTLLEQHTSLLV